MSCQVVIVVVVVVVGLVVVVVVVRWCCMKLLQHVADVRLLALCPILRSGRSVY